MSDFVNGAILVCFWGDNNIVGFNTVPPRVEGTIDTCPKCGKLAEWFTWEYPVGSLFLWDERER